MPVSVEKLVAQANARIALGGQDLEDTARLVGIANATDAIYSVPTTADLPPAANNTGRMIHIADINVYRYSNGTEWTNDYDTSLVQVSGEVFSWGINRCGLLLNNTLLDASSPVQELTSSTTWCKVSGGGDHTLAIKSDGTLWSWGVASNGVLGDGTVIPRSSPVQEISSSTNWCQVSAGYCHSTAIKSDGTLWAWGAGGYGRLGDNTTVSKSSPVQEISSSTNWCQVSGGQASSLGIKSDGTLWAWGSNFGSRLGDGTNVNKSSPIREASSSTTWLTASISSHSVGIKTDGTLWSWGQNLYGQLGTGNTIDCSVPVRESSSSTDWCYASSGDRHSTGIKTNGTMLSWGQNTAGKLGTGNTTNRCVPTQEASGSTTWCASSTREDHTSAIKTDGTLWGWGCNRCGKLGDGTIVNKCSPVQEISSSTNWWDTSSGTRHTIGLKLGVVKGFTAI